MRRRSSRESRYPGPLLAGRGAQAARTLASEPCYCVPRQQLPWSPWYSSAVSMRILRVRARLIAASPRRCAQAQDWHVPLCLTCQAEQTGQDGHNSGLARLLRVSDAALNGLLELQQRLFLTVHRQSVRRRAGGDNQHFSDQKLPSVNDSMV